MAPSGVKSDGGRNLISNKQESFYELTKHLAGSVEGPSDLVHDKRHMNGFGQMKQIAKRPRRNKQNQLARECSKLDRKFEQTLAEEGLLDEAAKRPEY